EDVHSYVEAKLFDRIGPLAGKLHTGRSRNDQVATDLKLWLHKACSEAVAQIAALRATLERKAVAESDTSMPGYTHSKQAATITLSHLSHLAEDLIFYTTDEAAYAELPDAMATGSSRMPQKKNPDVLELARGHAGRAIGELTGLLSVLKGLPLAYDKDLQLD